MFVSTVFFINLLIVISGNVTIENFTLSDGKRNISSFIDDNIKVCIPKCCPTQHIFYNRSCKHYQIANNTNQIYLDMKVNKRNYCFKQQKLQCKDRTLLMPKYADEDMFFVKSNASLDLLNWGTLLGPQQYCLDIFKDEVDFDFEISAFICILEEMYGEEENPVNSYGMIISMPFLLATFIAYALLPDRNLHMKALMSYVINLMFGYLLLVIIQLSKTQFSVASCKSLGYFCLFFFMVSFFWMNVICIDIWFGFSGYRGFSGSKSAERKRFLLYCAYAWGMSILHILIVLLIDSVSNPSSWYAPGIGNGQCFIKTGWAELLYFYGPMGILITINVTLFVITAFKIRSLKKDTAMLKKDDSKRHSYENDKQKFNLYVKLLFAMGVNWSMEIISWAVIWNYKDLSTYIWYLTDFCNAAYGVFIFFIFVFKKNIWKLLQKRYYSFIGKPHLAHSVGQTQTRTTSYSTANTSLHETTNHHPGGGGGGSHITETSVLTTEA